MLSISKKELDKFMKDNPDSEATKAIQEQLGEATEPETCTSIIAEATDSSGQIRNTASYLEAEKVNELHREVMDSFNERVPKWNL